MRQSVEPQVAGQRAVGNPDLNNDHQACIKLKLLLAAIGAHPGHYIIYHV